MAGKIKVINETNCDLLISVYKEGDDAIPYNHAWVHNELDMDIGDFTSVGVGIQVQAGGNFVDSPKAAPFAKPNQTVKITFDKTVTFA